MRLHDPRWDGLIYGEEDGAECGKKFFVRGFDVVGIEPGVASIGAAERVARHGGVAVPDLELVRIG